MQRRRLLKLGMFSGAVLALAATGASMWRPGVVGGTLGTGGRELFRAVGQALLAGSLPEQPAAKAAALDGLLVRVDELVAGLPPHAQAELSQLIALLCTGPGRLAMAGLVTDWAQADVPTLHAALDTMRSSRASIRLQTYHALHDIVGGAYFSAPSAWTQLGYPGPLAI
jgi:hypothetical protein